ncbi:MAG: hypothetical protein ACREUZ_08785 [Burkholderiales bacterium]
MSLSTGRGSLFAARRPLFGFAVSLFAARLAVSPAWVFSVHYLLHR